MLPKPKQPCCIEPQDVSLAENLLIVQRVGSWPTRYSAFTYARDCCCRRIQMQYIKIILNALHVCLRTIWSLALLGLCWHMLYVCTYVCTTHTHTTTKAVQSVCGKVAQAGSPACLAAARVRLTPARGGFTAAGSSSALSSAAPVSCLRVMHRLW